METVLAQKCLDDGAVLNISVVRAPDETRRDAILQLLSHKGPDWDVHLESALAGEAEPLETRWYLGSLAGDPTANVMTVERHGVGILGHVYTREAYRRRGIARCVLQAALEDFDRRGGRTLLLGTGYESVAYRLYESLGFRSLRGGFMQYLHGSRDEFTSAWFEAGEDRLEQADWQHWPLITVLGAYPDQTGSRSLAWGLWDIANLESEYCSFMTLVQRSLAGGIVSVTASGAAVACATWTPFKIGHCGASIPDTWLVDAFSHPLHKYKLNGVLAALRLPEGKAIAIIPSDDQERISAFQNVGFAREGALQDFVPLLHRRTSAMILGRSSERRP